MSLIVNPSDGMSLGISVTVNRSMSVSLCVSSISRN